MASNVLKKLRLHEAKKKNKGKDTSDVDKVTDIVGLKNILAAISVEQRDANRPPAKPWMC